MSHNRPSNYLEYNKNESGKEHSKEELQYLDIKVK
jgi:hypothetical protein